LLAGCHDDRGPGGAFEGVVCGQVVDGEQACFEQHVLRGRVLDAEELTAISGARVVARDATGAAVSRVAVTDARGVYVLTVQTPPDKADARTPRYTLVATAPGYRVFEKTSVVATTSEGPAERRPALLESSVTDIALSPIVSDGAAPWLTPAEPARSVSLPQARPTG
jgi:hypothetical protein